MLRPKYCFGANVQFAGLIISHSVIPFSLSLFIPSLICSLGRFFCLYITYSGVDILYSLWLSFVDP